MKKQIFLIFGCIMLSLNAIASDLDNKASNKISFKNSFPFKQPSLPYKEDALEPYISARTFNFHYQKHHNAYFLNLNKLIENTNLTNKSLEEVIMLSYNQENKKNIFNNAAQAWNHSFFWKSMKANGGGDPYGKIAELINRDFGSYNEFRIEFKKAAKTQFGSGWAWLAIDESDKLIIMKTSNADLPMLHNKKALITLDVWEHAYYLDYLNLRNDYIDVFLDYLINWDFANEMLAIDNK